MNSRGNLWGIILAGGSGQRLQPFLRRRGHVHPIKQFCAVVGRRTMLQHTWRRIEMLVPRERVITVIDATHADLFRAQLADRAAGTVVVQPANRETGPGTLLPLAHILRADPEARVAILPSDHFVHEEERFMRHVSLGAELVWHGRSEVTILGVEAERADSDYGWIEVCRAGRHRERCALPVVRFWEKPALPMARRLYEQGHLWSTMVTVARAASLWDLFRLAQPELHRTFERIRWALGTADEPTVLREAYEPMPNVSLSKGVFERLPSRLTAISVADVHWSDWGREERVIETLARLGESRSREAHETPAVRAGTTR